MGCKSRNILIIGSIVLLISAACDRNRNHPGWDVFPDMYYSHAYETYTPNPVFDDGTTMREPVEGTIPRHFIPFQYTLAEGERERAGRELNNPLEIDSEILKKGRALYGVYCSSCHGEKGKGEGYLYTSGMYIVKPRSLVDETAQALADGGIYHSITLGFGSMGAHGSQILPDDRWKIISYITEVLQEQAIQDSIRNE